MTITSIIIWIVFGLVVGAIARFLLPGRQNMGWGLTILLGIVGSFVGGSIGSFLFHGTDANFQPGGWIASVLGAILVLFLYSRFAAKG